MLMPMQPCVLASPVCFSCSTAAQLAAPPWQAGHEVFVGLASGLSASTCEQAIFYIAAALHPPHAYAGQFLFNIQCILAASCSLHHQEARTSNAHCSSAVPGVKPSGGWPLAGRAGFAWAA